jgi:cell division septation protein DedD
MKRMDPGGKSSVFYIGKGVIILSIITTSSLGFLLGFFVGRNTQPPVVNPVPVVMPSAAASPQNADPLKQEAASPQPQQPPETRKSVQPGIQASHPAQENPHPDKTQPKVTSGPKQEQGKVRAEEANTGTKKYAVQAGAFRNFSEADILKAKLKKKGYSASVAVVETKKHEKLYKVLVGKFSKKNEAELFAVRIGKIEGLRAFVTVRKQEELRSQ